MTPTEIIEVVKQHNAQAVTSAVAEGHYPHVVLQAGQLKAVAEFLKTDPRLRFDLLRCISATDRPTAGQVELAYDLISTTFRHTFALKVVLDGTAPQAESVAAIWPAADWHEREAFDLMGVNFLNHPDLRRILLPEDWPGHPLRKDHQEPVEYKGLKLNP
jgi:NADH-quinone oxidoreductase subunit C